MSLLTRLQRHFAAMVLESLRFSREKGLEVLDQLQAGRCFRRGGGPVYEGYVWSWLGVCVCVCVFQTRHSGSAPDEH